MSKTVLIFGGLSLFASQFHKANLAIADAILSLLLRHDKCYLIWRLHILITNSDFSTCAIYYNFVFFNRWIYFLFSEKIILFTERENGSIVFKLSMKLHGRTPSLFYKCNLKAVRKKIYICIIYRDPNHIVHERAVIA